MRKIFFVLAVLLAGFSVVHIEAGLVSGGVEFGIGGRHSMETAPEPRLISPVSETLDLTGKDTVEFKWSPFEGKVFKRRFYEFRIYKGREQLAKNIILKKKIAANVPSIVLKTDMFEDAEVYTWALRQAYYDQKSDWAYSAFVVIKKK